MHNNNWPQPNTAKPSKTLAEGLQYQDLDGMLKPTIHVDEFSSKMGDDADVMVVSFYVRDKQAAKDLVSWFEKGYDFVLDADRSPGEIKPNRYLVYVEMRRRSSAPQNIEHLLSDLTTLCEHQGSDWMVKYGQNQFAWNEDDFARIVPLTPDAYRAATEQDLNEMRIAAGLPVKTVHDLTKDMRELQAAAGII
jgi:hypothetical protein